MYAAGYGFPSGHSVDATVTYGSLAMVVRAGKRWQRSVAASLLIGLVALSRVVLGVHYPIDVIVGIALGLGTLIVVSYVFDRNVLYILISAMVVAVLGIVVTHGDLESLVLFGGVGSALLGWVWKERQAERGHTDV